MQKPFKSESSEINRLMEWVISNFATKDDDDITLLKQINTLSIQPPPDMLERELRIREEESQNRLMIRYKNKKDGKDRLYYLNLVELT